MRISGYILYLTIALSLLFFSCSKGSPESDEAFRLQILQEVRNADKLVLAQMDVTKTVTTDRTDWYKVGKRVAVYSYNTYVRAYLDLTDFSDDDIEVDDRARTVTITLPPVRTEIAGRDPGLKKVYENIGVFRTEIGARERAEMKEKANASLRKQIKENPEFTRKITDQARRKASDYFTSLLAPSGYQVTVNFSDQWDGVKYSMRNEK